MRPIKHFFATLPLDTPELSIRGVGVQEWMPPLMIDRRKGTGDWLFMYFYGPSWIGSGAAPVHCPLPTMMIWTPARAHLYGDPGQRFRHSWMHCSGSAVSKLVRRSRLKTNTPLTLRDASVVERNLLSIYAELTRADPPDGVIIGNLLENWLREIHRELAPARARGSLSVPTAILEVRRYLESEYEREIDLSQLARRAGMSVSHFCASFKQAFGVSAIDYLIRQRMHRAAYFLRDQNLRVSEVGVRVGYDDAFHFSKLFKKHFGVSPREMRNAALVERA